MKVGDLVKMKTHETGLVGIVVDLHPHANNPHQGACQVGIRWLGGSGKVDWEPDGWLEVISESR